MAKDPAFLFYSSDFIMGTFTMSDEQVGKYIRILCVQHQKGRLSKSEISKLSGNDPEILSKFKIDENSMYYNEKLEKEADRRREYSESRRNNKISKKTNTSIEEKEDMKNISETYVEHMETETETENKTTIENEKGVAGEKTALDFQIDEVLTHFSNITGKKIDITKEVNRKFVRGRLKEKIPIEDLKKIIELKNFRWKDDMKMREYIRIETLFNPTKCNSYLVEVKDLENNPDLMRKIIEHANRTNNTTGKQYSAMEAYKQQLQRNVQTTG